MTDHPTQAVKDEQLKLALARMLPEKVKATPIGEFFWWNPVDPNEGPIKDTEWLHVCWLVEKTLADYETPWYRDELSETGGTPTCPIECCVEHWSWQSRSIALAKVKGVGL